MKSSQALEIITAVGIHGGWVKLLQARREPAGAVTLLGMKARRIVESDEESLAQALQQLVQSLPETPREVVGLFPSNALFTRYLSLPSQDPEELRAMALYQMEGSLPYSIQDCVVSVKALEPMGEATRVLAVVAHRPELERLLRICQKAGLKPGRITPSAEAVGLWHQACWPEGAQPSSAWLAAEFTQEGLDLGVFLQGSLLYVRHVPHLSGDLGELAARLEETAQAYQKEKIGPGITRVTLSGRLDLLPPAALERLEAALALPVHGVDPLEASPFRDALAVAAKEFASEVSFSDLMGVVCAPRLLELDLLPVEVRIEQERQAFMRQARRAGALLSLLVLLLAVWGGLRTASVFWTLRRYQAQARSLEPQVRRVQRKAEVIRRTQAARELYGRQMLWIRSSAERLGPGMTLQFLGLEEDRLVVLRGSAPDWAAMTAYAAALRGDPIWKRVVLRSARVQEGQGNVEFELALFP